MGVVEATSMTKQEASERIEHLMNVESQEQWNWLFERQGDWITDRFILHAELYTSEFQKFLDTQLPDVMHTYVRGRVTGASETLTKAKIRNVIHAVTAEDRSWWQDSKRKERFFDKLNMLYPGCCTVGPQTRQSTPNKAVSTPQKPTMRFSLWDHRTFGALFSHYSQFCEPWELSFNNGQKTASPHDWLQSLDAATLSAPICEYQGDNTGSRFTAEVKRFLHTARITFSISWHSDRHGWADSGPGSRTVHYFVPRAWMTDPPYTGEGMLISLCKRNWIRNDSPFYTVDPSRALCKTCAQHHENWNSGNS